MTIRRRHVAPALLVLLVVALAANAARLLALRRANARNGSVVHAHDALLAVPVPYTAVLREVVTAPDGTKHQAATLTIAATATGTVVQMLGEPGRGGRRIHMPEGLVIQTKDDLKVRSTTVAEESYGHWHRAPASNCLSNLYGEPATGKVEDFIREETRDGHRAAKIKAGNATQWFALDAGCALIGSFSDYGQGRTSEMRLISLALGNPAPALVNLSDFAEGPPSRQVSAVPNAKCEGDCAERLKKHLARLDAAYQSRRPQR